MNGAKLRLPAVAGSFYPASRKLLEDQISGLADKEAAKSGCLGCVLPHAGYIYSGNVAAKTVSRIIIPEKVVLFGPNHTGKGKEFSLMAEGAWRTPLGDVEIDSSLAEIIAAGSAYLEKDSLAHLEEHSLEVELPLLQFFKSSFKIVPIAIRSADFTAIKKLGREIAVNLIKAKLEKSVLCLASSDLTHYEPQEIAAGKDKQAIEAILELNEDKLIQRVRELDISMCGCAPVATMLACVKALGAKEAELVKYETSAAASGDTSSVVGYAGIIIKYGRK